MCSFKIVSFFCIFLTRDITKVLIFAYSFSLNVISNYTKHIIFELIIDFPEKNVTILRLKFDFELLLQ